MKNSVAYLLISLISIITALVEFIGMICFMSGVTLALALDTVHEVLIWTGFGLGIGGSVLTIIFKLILSIMENFD